MTLLDFQPVLGRRNIRPPHFASKVSYSASPQASAYLFFLDFERPTLQGQKRAPHFLRNFLAVPFLCVENFDFLCKDISLFFHPHNAEVSHLSQE